jgi:eukaryotic-like serine/threonine-protein kinase
MVAPGSPRLLGRYALYDKIASGGMASIHIGRLLGPVGFARTVAIKRMHPHFVEDPDFVSMFVDEARLAARIRHPNVVSTLDVVAMEGELFLVMDFVQGESLARLLSRAKGRGERIPPEMVATIMVGALHGLHAAHEAKDARGEPLGVVHRDVSPDNILVGTDGVARVLDFGVAMAVGRIQTTRDGQIKGKLAYLAPEQLRGEVSRTADVYSAAAVLWEALTGRGLFRGESDGHTLGLVLKGCDVPPSAYVEGLPPALDRVTMRGLSVDPALRFPTARDMARALEEAIALTAASRIGDWVESAAKETLEARSARIAAIEHESNASAHPPDPAFAPSSTSGAFPASSASQPDLVSTQLTASMSAPDRARRRRMAFVATASAGALVAALLFAKVSSHSGTPSPPANVPVVPAAIAQAPASPPPLPSTTAESPLAEAPPPQTVPPPPPAARARPATHAPASAPTATTASRCSPPWSIDARGVRVFKRECL